MEFPHSDFAQRFQKTHAFFAPENLESLVLKYEGEAILLVIDVQKEFCDPQHLRRRGNNETVAVSERIQSIVPAFREAGVPVYAIYFTNSGEKARDQIDFYKFQPAPEDKLFAKSTDSAFQSGKLKSTLESEKRKLLLVCGFNQSACVKRTILSARSEGYDVCLLEDLVGNDNLNSWPEQAKAQMLKKGAVTATSRGILQQLKKTAAKP